MKGNDLPLAKSQDDSIELAVSSCPPCKEPEPLVADDHAGLKCKILEDPIVENLRIFSADSANDDKYKQLWFHSARMYIPMLNELLEMVNFEMTIDTCDNYDNQDEFTSKLAALYNHYGSDKANHHDYYKLYGHILFHLGVDKHLNVLEIGMGTNNPKYISTMGGGGKPGASLRAFRDALPNASIRGADIDADILFTEERIETTRVDQMNRDTFSSLEDKKYHLIIDDGLHSVAANLNTLLWAMKHVEDGGYIVIEDIFQMTTRWAVVNFILAVDRRWKIHAISCRLGGLFVLQKKSAQA